MKLITFESMMRPVELPSPSLPGLTPECIAASVEYANQLRSEDPGTFFLLERPGLVTQSRCLIWMLAGWQPEPHCLRVLRDLEMLALVRSETQPTGSMHWRLTEPGTTVAIILRTWERDRRLARTSGSGFNPTAHISN